MANVHQTALLASIASLLESGKYSDLTITCADLDFHVHRAIVCPASSVIAAKCERWMTDGTSAFLDDQNDPQAVDRMVKYMYKQTYSVDDSPASTEPPHHADSADRSETHRSLVAHVKVFAAADFYNVAQLKTLAVQNFQAIAAAEWQIEGFVDLVKDVYSVTREHHHEMRDALLKIAVSHITELVQNVDFMSQLREVDELQEFAANMLLSSTVHHDQVQKTLRSDFKMSDKLVDVVRKLYQKQETKLYDSIARADRMAWEAEDALTALNSLKMEVASVPSQCSNVQCKRDVRSIFIEGRGPLAPGGGGHHTDWWVKCLWCKCKLNKRGPVVNPGELVLEI